MNDPTLRGAEFFRPHRPDSRILVTFLAFAVVAFGLILLGSEVAEGDIFAIDKTILRGLRLAGDAAVPIGPLWLKSAMIDFTALGSTAVLTLITVLAGAYLVAVRKFSSAAYVVVAIGLGAILSKAIKGYFLRPRPEIVPHFVEVTSASFPSGHSMNSAIVYLTLAVLLARGEENRRVQVFLVSTAIFLTVLVGTTRAYLGVHWPSDILAGWSIGAMWAAGTSLAAKSLWRQRTNAHLSSAEPEREIR